jgi:hypothetical protein
MPNATVVTTAEVSAKQKTRRSIWRTQRDVGDTLGHERDQRANDGRRDEETDGRAADGNQAL